MKDNEVFKAVTEGECDICWLPILPGDPIVYVTMDGDDGYAHESCASGETG